MKLQGMRYISLFMVAILMFSHSVFAGDKPNDANGIKWMTWDEVQVAMKKKPKRVLVDVYTSWCGWCKVMDKKTFAQPDVIKYMNENFYAVKFNAETKEEIMFMGKAYGFSPQHNANLLAAQLMGEQMSYPTTIFMDKNFANPQPLGGYLKVAQLEIILKYLNEEVYKTTKMDDYQKTFKPQWQEIAGN